MINIAVCDDIPIVANYLENLILKHNPQWNVDVFHSGRRLLHELENNSERYNCFFLDIDLPDIDGLLLAEKIRENDIDSLIIFLTSHEEYMPEVFRFHTFDYLVKPIRVTEVNRVLISAEKNILNKKRLFAFSSNKSDFTLPLSEITFFEKKGRKVILHTINETFTFYMRSIELKAKLPSNFIQSHNSFIFNCDYLYKLEKDRVYLRDTVRKYDFDLPLSRSYKKMAHDQIVSYTREVF